MKTVKLVGFFDYIDRDSDVEDMKLITRYVEDELDIKIKFVNSEREDLFAAELSNGSIGVIDYGALNYGQSGMKDHYDRYMMKVIEEHPSVDFIFRLTMGRDAYKDELFDFVNVHTISTAESLEGWVNLIKDLRC